MLSVCNGIGNEVGRVNDTSRFGKVDHSVSIVLLGTRVCIGKKGVDTVDTSERNTWLVGENVTSADKLYPKAKLAIYQ